LDVRDEGGILIVNQPIQGKDESELVLLDDRPRCSERQKTQVDRTASLPCGARVKLFFPILALLVGFILAPSAWAGDLVVSRTVREDATGSLTIADVAGRVTSPLGPAYAIPSADTVHWICLRVKAPAHGSKVVLYLRPNYLNDVRLYEAGPGNPLSWKTRATGNQYAWRDRDRASISLGFVVEVTAPEATYYLRVKAKNPATLSVQALEPAEAASMDHQRDLVMVFFVTAMLCLLIWAILSFLLDHQLVTGLFALHQAAYTLYGFVVTGYLAPLVPARIPQLADAANIFLYCAINFTPVLFCRALFKPYHPPAPLMRGLNLLLCTFPVLLAATALGYGSQALIANAILIKITLLYLAVVALSLRVESTPSRRLLRAFFVLILLSNVTFWIAGRSAWLSSRVSLSAIQQLIADGLVIGGLFAVILHTRARQVLLEAQQAALDLVLVQKKFEIEQELKVRAEEQAQTDYLTGQLNRRRFVELAERELARSIRFQRPFTLLMIDVDHFKAVNDTWGHSVGDAVLKEVAHLIHATLRDADLFGRTGGEEFAAVIVETDGDGAIEVAERLCSTVADALIVPQEAGRIRISISIGLAQLNGRSISFNHLLMEADGAMYDAKEAGRNRVAVCA
jgi:diguanylate cyclase (GGDEF)-like protein